jgi:hypothetical protein
VSGNPSRVLADLTLYRPSLDNLLSVIPEIDIWRVANLMLKRYGDEADIESALRAEEFAEKGDWTGEAIWRRIIDAIGQLVNITPPGRCTDWGDDAALTIPVRGSPAVCLPICSLAPCLRSASFCQPPLRPKSLDRPRSSASSN